MSEIQELEAKLVESQKKLNDLQYEVNAIHMELLKLKDEEKTQVKQEAQQYVSPYRQQPAAQGQPTAQEQQVVQQQPVVQQPVAAQGQPDVQPSIQPDMQQTQVQEYQPKPKYWEAQMPGYKGPKPDGYWGPSDPTTNVKPARDTEWLVGIRGMGIVASILVFISFILFAMYLIPGLTDEIKMALMFIISGGLTAVGLFFWLRKKESLFFLSLGACGIGALYISLFVSNIYFGMIEQIPLYILLLIWAAGVLYLSKIKPLLFEIIGLSGIIISVMLGTFSCVDDRDGIMLGVLAIYLAIGILAFMLFRLKDNVGLVISNVAACIGTFTIVIGCFDVIYDTAFPCIVMILFTMVLIVMNLILINEDRYTYLPVFGAIFTAMLLLSIKAAIPEEEFARIMVLIIAVILYIGIELYHKLELRSRAPIGAGKSVGVIIWEAMLLIVSAVCIMKHDGINEYVGVFALIIPLLAYGFIADDKQSKISSLALYMILAVEVSITPWAGLFYVIVVFALFAVMMFVNRNQYNGVLKILFYITFIIGLTVWYVDVSLDQDWDGWVSPTILLAITGALNFAACKTPFGKNWLTGDEEKGFRITTYVINAFLMIEAMLIMYDAPGDGVRVAAVLIAIMLFIINSRNLLKTENSLAIVYVGVKFTVLPICILDSFSAVNYVISISVFVLATLFILLGFKMKLKSLRIYGLVTTMIFAVKLVMVDIKYDNVLGNALSFFISGLICFGISALYSIADKKLFKAEAATNTGVVTPEYVNPEYVDPNVVNPQYVDPNAVNQQYVDPNLVNQQYVDPNAMNQQYVDPNTVNQNTFIGEAEIRNDIPQDMNGGNGI